MSSSSSSCCSKSKLAKASGPGYSSPAAALASGPRETVLFVTCVRPHQRAPDYLATVDVDPGSPTYGTVVGRTEMTAIGDEVHHSGWNTCSSCHSDGSKCRNRLILPCLNSDRVYVVAIDKDIDKDDKDKGYRTSLAQVIEPEALHRLGVSAPHTTHCLPSGQLMISCLGDETGANKGTFLLIDPPNSSVPNNFTPSKLWNQEAVPFGYDYWYQPRHDVMVSTEWGAPRAFKQGFSLEDLKGGAWSTGRRLQSLDLATLVPGTCMPLEVRFLHEPAAAEGYVGCALSGNRNSWTAEEVIKIEGRPVSGWSLAPTLPALITDILLSLDDRFLYLSAWAFGEVRQYDISSTTSKPQLTSVVRLGGIPATNPSVKVLEEKEELHPDQIFTEVKGIKLQAGAQMLQLSLDGARLYVTNSLHSAWDRQFYPGVVDQGSQLLKIDVDTKGGKGKMTLDQDFVVDFGQGEPLGPALAHEMRYPGGDCTSDIWI
ncbi:hypothetical protein TYRP_011351 [Tyrophagus putrescentiae]|nr:hypothetical protein TYRP_011351 [Tyrophagus putrescentiae]